MEDDCEYFEENDFVGGGASFRGGIGRFGQSVGGLGIHAEWTRMDT